MHDVEISGFSATQILREINFGKLGAPNTAILPIWAAMNIELLEIFDYFKCEIPKYSKFKVS